MSSGTLDSSCRRNRRPTIDARPPHPFNDKSLHLIVHKPWLTPAAETRDHGTDRVVANTIYIETAYEPTSSADRTHVTCDEWVNPIGGRRRRMRSRKWRKLIRRRRRTHRARPSSIKRRCCRTPDASASAQLTNFSCGGRGARHSLIKKRIQFWARFWSERETEGSGRPRRRPLCVSRYLSVTGEDEFDAGDYRVRSLDRLKRRWRRLQQFGDRWWIVQPLIADVINAHRKRRPCPWGCIMSFLHLLSLLW